MLSRYRFRQWLRIVRWQAITWTNVDPDISPYGITGHNELKCHQFMHLQAIDKIFRHYSPDAWLSTDHDVFASPTALAAYNDDVIKWKHFPRYRPFHRSQRPVTRSFDFFFDLRLNKRLSKQWWGWWFETLPRPLWRHSKVFIYLYACCLNASGRIMYACVLRSPTV